MWRAVRLVIRERGARVAEEWGRGRVTGGSICYLYANLIKLNRNVLQSETPRGITCYLEANLVKLNKNY